MTSAVQKENGLLRAAFPAGHHYVKSHLPATRGEKEIAIEKHGPSKLARHSADAPSIETYCPTFPEKKKRHNKEADSLPLLPFRASRKSLAASGRRLAQRGRCSRRDLEQSQGHGSPSRTRNRASRLHKSERDRSFGTNGSSSAC